jgi:D-alanyl-D-alanine carboxypeptidase
MTELVPKTVREAAEYAATWIAYQAALRGVPGGVVGVRLGGETLVLDAFGKANLERGEAMRTDHIFRIASHSKTFTAVAVMRLVEQDRLRLDDTLGRYVEGLGQEVASVSLRSALSHAGGVIRDGLDTDFWQLDRPFPTKEELIRIAGDRGGILPPNDRFKYSNVAYSLLGQVIETVTGQPYVDYLQTEIVERLGLTDTGPETTPDAQARMVTGYAPRWPNLPRKPVADVPTGAMAPATGFYSTAGNLLRYGQAHLLGNEELLSDRSKREMQAPYWETGSGDRYGLGLTVEKIADIAVVGHGGSFPGHSTRTFIAPHDGLVVTVLLNQSNGPAKDFASGILHFIGAAHAESRTLAENVDRYRGRFWSTWGAHDVVRLGSRLFVMDPSAQQPWTDSTEVTVTETDVLRMEDKDGYGAPGEEMRYERDAGGEVTRVRVAGSSAYPEHEFLRRLGADGAAIGPSGDN